MTDQQKPVDSGDKSREEEVAAYEKLRQYVKDALGNVRQKVNADTVHQAVEAGAEKLRSAGTFTSAAVAKAVTALRKDMAVTAERLGPKWEAFSEKSADLFSVWRDRGSVFLGQAATSLGGWLEKVGQKLEHQTYATGEMTHGGAFECQACHERIELARAGYVPPCPKCQATSFVRV
ncbi:MAG: zinc ribbon-containing protein [Betaproteobacteria bacterium]|nr:zinc ribbon-containing protein [Betaproteobacteria bacterium]